MGHFFYCHIHVHVEAKNELTELIYMSDQYYILHMYLLHNYT